MAKKQGFNLDDLKNKGMIEVTPGVFQKKSNPQPRDKKTWMQKQAEKAFKQFESDSAILSGETTFLTLVKDSGLSQIHDGVYKMDYPKKSPVQKYLSNLNELQFPLTDDDIFDVAGLNKIIADENNNARTLKLTLFGIPMPKQSVRTFIKDNRVMHVQTKELNDKKEDYIRQIRAQLPKDFKPFMTEVFVTKFHCIYPPLKGFNKKKMEAIRNGEIFYKNTQPDLIDNLKKLIFDCLGKNKEGVPLVLGNDGIIVGEDNTRKYYGMGGSILLTLTGY